MGEKQDGQIEDDRKKQKHRKKKLTDTGQGSKEYSNDCGEVTDKHKVKRHKPEKPLKIENLDSTSPEEKKNVHIKKCKKRKKDKSEIIHEVTESEMEKKHLKLDSQENSGNKPQDKHGQERRRIRKRKDKFKDKVPDFVKKRMQSEVKMEEVESLAEKTEEEIALEKMKKEKRERMRKKRIAKKLNKGKKIESTVAKDAALEYLQQWSTNRHSWKFQKVRQVWLLSNLYNTRLVSDENFVFLLRYLEDLKGRSRETTTQQAEQILSEAEKQEEGQENKADSTEEEEEEEEEEDGEKKKSKEEADAKEDSNDDLTASEKYKRARQILQILS